MKRAIFVIISAFLFITILSVTLDALTDPSPSWDSSTPQTNDDLVCSWSSSPDMTWTNVTILRNGFFYGSWNTTNTSITIPSENTTKEESWVCNVTLFNETANLTSPYDSVIILNTKAEIVGLFNSSGTNIGTYEILYEDVVYNFTLNATDADGDDLTYYPSPGFCENTQNVFTCSPDDSDVDAHTQSKITPITFNVHDGEEGSILVVNFNVTPVNDAPYFSPALTYWETAVNETDTYDIDATDEEGDTNLTFSLVTSLPGAWLSINPTTGVLTYDASGLHYSDVNASGWNITVRVNDSDGAYTGGSFILNITSVGRAPTIINYTPNMTNGYYTLAEDSGTFQIIITANDSDDEATHEFSCAGAPVNMDCGTLQGNADYGNISIGQINFSPTDVNVGTFNITLIVEDQETLTDTVVFYFNVTNTQDAPAIYNESYDVRNTNSNTNMTNVTSYATAPFVFVVNATDDDLDSGDTLTFDDNTSLFNISLTTGIISFTPTTADAKDTPYSINISVTDGTDTAWAIMTLWVLNNTPPYFDPYPLPNKDCPESLPCTYDLGTYANDSDSDDSIISYSVSAVGASPGNFSYNSTTGVINFTPSQASIAEYMLNVIITDTRGATNSTTFVLNITNTQDAPVLVDYDFSAQTIVENHPFSFELSATDFDLNITNTTENLTFADNLSFTEITYDRTANIYAYATLSMDNPVPGNHTIRINVTDADGLFDEETFTFEVFNDSLDPEIRLIKPYGNSSDSYAVVDEFINTTVLGASSTSIVLYENTTYQFAHETWDEYISSLDTTWYYDDVQVSTDWNYTRNFTFFSSGSHQMKLLVEDNRLDNATFLWNLSITNINRAPQLVNDLADIPPINITPYTGFNYLGHTTDSGYSNTTIYFYDPDDDPNGDFAITGSEINRLDFTKTRCPVTGPEVATITISETNIVVTPVTVGTCQVVFTAYDGGGLSSPSDTVTINVTAVAEGSNETTVEEQPSGGGGSTTRTSYIPLKQETETPEPINIIAPKIVTMYNNQTMIIPFDVTNTWHEDLFGITLGANTNASDVMTNLSTTFIEELPVNTTVSVDLMVSNYRLGENYEIEISANISEPEFEDGALIILTSIEQASEGDQVEVKVTFARDLFNEHPECQELNELLDKANEELANNNYVEARRYVDTAINGCKYIVSSLDQRTERPDQLSKIITLDQLTFQTILYLALAFLVVVTIAFIIYYHFTTQEGDDI